MTIAIERLQLDELQSFLREQAEDVFPDLKDEQRLMMLAEKWSTSAECCSCRQTDGSLVGMIVFYDNRPETGVAYIPHVYVCSRCRGQKIFSSMFHRVEDYVRSKGFRSIRLEVKKDNAIAIKAYLHVGFTLSGEALNTSYYMQFMIQ